MTRGKRLSGVAVLLSILYFGVMGMENDNALDFGKALITPGLVYAAAMFGADLMRLRPRSAQSDWEGS